MKYNLVVTSKYLQIVVTPPNQDQDKSEKTLKKLLGNRLRCGSQTIKTPANFSWNGDFPDMGYYDIDLFTFTEQKASSSLVPMIELTNLNGRKELVIWIDETIS